jgi:HK97 family phage major capsid protein
MSQVLDDLTRQRDERIAAMDDAAARLRALPADAPEEERQVLDTIFQREAASAERLSDDITKQEVILRARKEVKPQDDTSDNGNAPQIRVGKEPLTYRQGATDSHGAPVSYFRDLWKATSKEFFDQGAEERIRAHMTEMRYEQRDLSSSATAGGEFIPPLYLQNQWIELLRAARPTADAVTRLPLPPNTNSIVLPRLATGAATAIQTADNAAVNETDPTTNSISAGVKTIAGQVDMSRQLFEFSNPGMDDVIFRDLARDYATKLNIQVISGSGSAGQALGIRNVSSINAVTYTDASPTVGELYAKLADAIQRISTAFGVPDTIVMHPRRWATFLGAVDTAGRPLALAGNAQNSLADQTSNAPQGLVGQIMGIRIVVDPSLPTNLGAGTNEDMILVFDSNQIFLWEEGAPRNRVFEDIGSGTLTVRLSVWGYFAFMAGRYPALISTIGGTGLITPTF